MTNAVLGKRDRELARPKRRIGEPAPVVCDDDIGRVATQSIEDFGRCRKEVRPHAEAILERSNVHVRSGVDLLPFGTQLTDLTPGCDEKLDAMPVPAERNCQKRVRGPGPTRTGDAEDLACDHRNPSRSHRTPSAYETTRLRAARRYASRAAGGAGSAAVRVTSSARERRCTRERFLEVLHDAQRLGRMSVQTGRRRRARHERDRDRHDLCASRR